MRARIQQLWRWQITRMLLCSIITLVTSLALESIAAVLYFRVLGKSWGTPTPALSLIVPMILFTSAAAGEIFGNSAALSLPKRIAGIILGVWAYLLVIGGRADGFVDTMWWMYRWALGSENIASTIWIIAIVAWTLLGLFVATGFRCVALQQHQPYYTVIFPILIGVFVMVALFLPLIRWETQHIDYLSERIIEVGHSRHLNQSSYRSNPRTKSLQMEAMPTTRQYRDISRIDNKHAKRHR